VSGDEASPDAPAPVLEGDGLRIGIVCGRFNSRITMRLLDGARRGLAAAGVTAADVAEVWVPGAFEIPLAAKAMAQSGRYHAVIGLGCVIRGETTHYDLVAGGSANGLQAVALETGLPMVFGVLTTEDVAQAEARSDAPGGHNVGEESAATAVEMARLVPRLRDDGSSC
jgi:6,7-dimethyl-8-ribityllumazine synthase